MVSLIDHCDIVAFSDRLYWDCVVLRIIPFQGCSHTGIIGVILESLSQNEPNLVQSILEPNAMGHDSCRGCRYECQNAGNCT